MSSPERKRSRKSVTSAPCEDPRLRVFDFNEDEEEENLSFFEGSNTRMETASSENVGEVSGEVQNMMINFEADINEAVVAKKQRMEACTEASCNAGDQEIKRVFKTEEQMQMLHTEHGQQFNALFQQWDSEMSEFQEQQENVTQEQDMANI